MNKLLFFLLGTAALSVVLRGLIRPSSESAADDPVPTAAPFATSEPARLVEGTPPRKSPARENAPAPTRKAMPPPPDSPPRHGASDHPQLPFALEASGLERDELMDLQRRHGVLDDLAPLRGLFGEDRHAEVVRQYLSSVRQAGGR